MVFRPWLRLLILFLSLGMTEQSGKAALIYLYDFPGSPGSGLASSQTNAQPSGVTFSDFSRINVGQVTSASGDNIFGSNNWNQTTAKDPTQYVGFSIAAAGGNVLNLTNLTFDLSRGATGPSTGEVDLFLNGSSTAYAFMTLSPTTSSTPTNFDFIDLVTANNVTSAEFRFYGWNSGGSGGQLYLDNVGTNGALAAVPEANTLLPAISLIVCALVCDYRGRRRNALRD